MGAARLHLVHVHTKARLTHTQTINFITSHSIIAEGIMYLSNSDKYRLRTVYREFGGFAGTFGIAVSLT